MASFGMNSKSVLGKYGLIIPKKKTGGAAKAHALFGDEDDSDEEQLPTDARAATNYLLKREMENKKVKKQTKDQLEKALEEDPNIFAYDEVYDDMAEKRQAEDPRQKTKGKKVEQQSRYFHLIKKKADERKVEEDFIRERIAAKEREREGDEFGDKEKFVTAGFKKKLLEMKKIEEDRKKQAEIDAKNDVRKKGDLSGFYSNLLTGNVAMGTGEAEEKDLGLNEETKKTAEEEEAERLENERREREAKGRRDRERARAALEQADELKKKRQREAELEEEELKKKYARRTTEDAVEAAKARALARRAKKKRPVAAAE